MEPAPENADQERSLHQHIVIAFSVIALLVIGLGAASLLFKVNGAVIAPGRVVVESNVKRVQHAEGGIVQEIHVRDGQIVEAGDKLLRIDGTLVAANHAVILQRLLELNAQEARLKAERDAQPDLIVSAELSAMLEHPESAAILEGQRALMAARLQARDGRKAQLEEQIAQFEEQARARGAQRDAKAEEIALIADELADLSDLLDKGLVERSRVTALMRDKAALDGGYGGFVAEIAGIGQAIAERRIQILQVDEDMRAEVVAELQAVRAEIAELTEQRVAVEERLGRVEIRAPRSGTVHQLAVHTVGGVIAAGEDLMVIVPKADLLVVEAQVAPTDIDQLVLAQEAVVRLSGFDQRRTPELKAEILTVSPDLVEDQQSGLSYYQVRLAIPEAEIARLDGRELIPGMPVEAFVQTGERTIMSYLVKPVTDHIAYAFREG